jgi:putative spermidine/putrescine transport system substrate-binding protein
MKQDSNHWSRISRRRVLGTGAAASLAGIAAPWVKTASAAQFAGKSVRVLTWSDPTGQAAVRNILKPFEQATGAQVIADLTGTTSDMIAKIKASAANPQYDLVILSGFGASTLAEAKLLEVPDLDSIPNTSLMFPEYRTGARGFGVGYYLWSDGLIYNSAQYPQAPKSYEVLWDKANEGKVIIPPAENAQAYELIVVAARMAGGDDKKPDAGFELLAQLRPQLLAVSQNAGQMADLFRSNSATGAAVYSPLVFTDFIPNSEYNMSGTYDLEEGFFVDLQFMVIPKGHPGDVDVINALIDYALDRQVQGIMAEQVWYGPTNKDAVLSEETKKSPFIPSPDVVAHRATRIDPDYLASVRDDWSKRYAQAIG